MGPLCDGREVWIQGSLLSISQRALSPAQPLATTQAKAQALAIKLIQSHGARHVALEALEFIEDHSATPVAMNEEFLTFKVPPTLSVPADYGTKGGAARESLVSALGIRPPRPPRDLDIVRRGSYRIPADDQVARELMGRDAELGARVELIRDMNGYLNSRDLTINEVVALRETVYASLLGVLDTFGQIIRPSRYRGGTLHRKPSLFGQSLLKMVRLYAEGVVQGENWSITGIPEEVSFSEFDLAVHLNKSFQRGHKVADTFLHTCELLSLLPASENRVLHALEQLEHLRHGERGLFPDVPCDLWNSVALE